MIIKCKLLALLLSNHGRGGDAREHLMHLQVQLLYQRQGALATWSYCDCFLPSLLMSCQSEIEMNIVGLK